MNVPKYVQEFQEFSLSLLQEKGSSCYFCSADSGIFAFYLLSSKTHKKDKLFIHPDQARYYYPACQTCMQNYARSRNKFIAGLIGQGVPNLQIDQFLASKIDEFIGLYTRGDASGFKQWINSLTVEKVAYVPNYDKDPIIQLLPSLASQLTPTELQFAIDRVKKFQEEFLFNTSSDYVILLSVVIQEVRLQRMMERLLSAKSEDKTAVIQKEYVALMDDYRNNLTALGVLRRERDKIGGSNIAEISDLIGDENQTRVEIDSWNDEMDKMLTEKEKRDDKLGYYD
jgi:hypothetical protein